MKKLTIVFLALVLVLALMGCAASQVQKATTPAQSSVPTNAPTTAAPTTTPTTVPSTTSGWEILTIALNKEPGFDMALEKFYEDEENEYKFGAIMSPWVTVYYRNGTTENIVDALKAGRATLADLSRFGFGYYVVSKKDGSMSTVWGAQN